MGMWVGGRPPLPFDRRTRQGEWNQLLGEGEHPAIGPPGISATNHKLSKSYGVGAACTVELHRVATEDRTKPYEMGLSLLLCENDTKITS